MDRRKFINSNIRIGIGAALSVEALMPKIRSDDLGEDSEEIVQIVVDASSDNGAVNYPWAYFGHDEANWSYTAHGKKLLGDLNALSPVPVFMRAHHLFTSGDPNSTALKWSPTNVYREDKEGNPIYDWENLDRMFDNYLHHGIKPLVELGFMPQDLSSKREPYHYVWKKGKIKDFGWTFPPKNYHKWADLVRAFIIHFRDRYGKIELESWLWEVWNEPDIFFWQGTTEDYLKLYDYAADVVKSELPNARIGGPTSTAPKHQQSADFLRAFLQHCLFGTNYVTGAKGSPLDYISFHTKGAASLVDDHVQMGIRNHLVRADWAFSIIAEFPSFKDLPIIIGESDPEGTAAYNVKDRPENTYRQGPIYPTYNIAVLSKLQESASKYGLRLVGNLTWAFHFEGSKYFEGFRELATNGINKAVLNGFRVLGLMKGRKLVVRGNGAVPLEEALDIGIRGQPDIDAYAARDRNSMTVLLWHYHDVDLPVEAVMVNISINQLPCDRALIEHYRVDENHSNPYKYWQEIGSPAQPSDREVDQLHRAGNLQVLASPKWIDTVNERLQISVAMPRFSISLVRLSW